MKTPKQLLSIYKGNSEAYNAMKKATTNMAIGQVLGFAGGSLIGWPLGTTLAGGEANWTLAAIGLPLVLISVPLSKAFNEHAIEAAENYNQSISQKFTSFRIRLGSGTYGYGLVINL